MPPLELAMTVARSLKIIEMCMHHIDFALFDVKSFAFIQFSSFPVAVTVTSLQS